MFILIQDKATNEIEALHAKDLSIGIHENWSMARYTNENGVYICRTIPHDKYYISCFSAD